MKQGRNYRHMFQQFISFYLWGAVGGAVYLVILVGFKEGLGMDPLFASAIGLIPNIIINFEIHKRRVFHDKEEQDIEWQLLNYGSVAVVFFIANLGLLYFLVAIWKMNYLWAQVFLPLFGLIKAFGQFLFSRLIFKSSPM